VKPRSSVIYRGVDSGVVTSVRVDRDGGGHAHISVWNRHGLAGTLAVLDADAEQVASRLLGRDLKGDGS
jgi:hypothetical protein